MAAYHVLVVDDNHEIRRMITATIRTLGAEIDVLDVPSAEEALFISSSLPLDLIVLDFRLPGMSGLEMVARLRKRKPAIKIILVTGVEDEACRKQVMEAGVAAYFFKPIEIARFLEAVKRALWSDQGEAPGVSGVPNTSGVPSTSAAPGASRTPGVGMPPVVGSAPAVSKAPSKQEQGFSSATSFQPTLNERLSALKQQLKATSVLLVNDASEVVELAGNPSPITSGPALLPALINTFRASQKAAEVLGKGGTESLVCFTSARQHIYLTSVDPSHALLIAATGYIEPDKLGLIDRAIRLAAQDLQSILESKREADSRKESEAEVPPAELPAVITVDQETLTGITELFSHAPKKGGQEQAQGFWETLEENGALDGKRGKDVISYDEARKMGLAPEDDKQP